MGRANFSHCTTVRYNMDVQTERAFQKQPHMFAGKARLLSRSSRKGARYVKSVGLGFKIPTKAREGRYIDKKCPFTGQVSIRGKLLRGVVHRTFMKSTITIRRDYLHYQKKYRRYEKRHKMISAHCSPAFDARPGDEVIIGECRPLAKTVRYNVVEVHEVVSRNTGAAGKTAK